MTINIYGFAWKVIYVERSELQGSDGRTCANDFVIKIASDMTLQAKRLTFLHELTHAILSCQGRWYQKKFTQEEMCEFIAYTHSMIVDIYDYYLGEEQP